MKNEADIINLPKLRKEIMQSFQSLIVILIFSFNLLNCQKNEDLKYVPFQLCSESVSKFSKSGELFVLDSQRIFIAGRAKKNYLKNKETLGDYTYIAKSLDRGKSWIKVDPPTSDGLSNSSSQDVKLTIEFKNENQGFVFTNSKGNTAFYTKDSGKTYEKIPHAEDEYIKSVLASEDSILFYKETLGISSSVNSPIYPYLKLYNLNTKTVTDIMLHNLTIGPNSSFSVRRYNDDILIVYSPTNSTARSVPNQRFYLSTDQAQTFQELVPTVENVGIIRFHAPNRAYRFYQNQLSLSTDLGNTWNTIANYPNTFPSNTYPASHSSNTYVYAYQTGQSNSTYYISNLPGNNWTSLQLPKSFLYFVDYENFAEDEDRYYYLDGSDIKTLYYPFNAEEFVSESPIYTHESDNLQAKYRVEWMLLGYMCLMF
ncbi:MAG: hypothetical protein GW938_02930 [Leptospira sp.]|nr:hypothetical protein [Leptospira sp.]NCS93602.1 hypothetical protein [Leptospira sp.]